MPPTLGHVVVGGGTGFVGSALCSHLRNKGHAVTVISRQPGPFCMTWGDLSKNGLPKGVTAVVSLAGQNVLDPLKRWNDEFKQIVVASRINTTQALVKAIVAADEKPKVFVATSGIGYYPPSKTAEYSEDSPGGKGDFFAQLCTQWEEAAKLPPSETQVRQVVIRSGVVLGRHGGMIKQIFAPFYLGTGGPIGGGDQYFPWIQIKDLVRLFTHAIENEKAEGILNGVAPEIITNRQFAQAFGRALWRPAIIPLPSFAVQAVFGAERAKMIIEGQKVFPRRTIESGFEYEYPNIQSACQTFNKLIDMDAALEK
uniref:EOG090X07KR n=1 Tax=Lynceus sp. MCZ IZ 141354 TaxID=1930659 RepID=A0A9N6WR83_9CRUS|nr:EOG090X07KR [Lynceus sp. MCZ IZ 141354]